MKVSFDFDSTLDRKAVQEYATELINRGIEVWICTSRLDQTRAPSLFWNDDLFKVAKYCGIKRENIIFCNLSDKYKHLKDKGFIFHIDDDNQDLDLIKIHTDIKPVSSFGNPKWREDCENILKMFG